MGEPSVGKQVLVKTDTKDPGIVVTRHDGTFLSRYDQGTTDAQIRDTLKNPNSILNQRGDALDTRQSMSQPAPSLASTVPDDLKSVGREVRAADSRVFTLEMKGDTPVVSAGGVKIAELTPGTTEAQAVKLIAMEGSPFAGKGVPAAPDAKQVALSPQQQPARELQMPSMKM